MKIHRMRFVVVLGAVTATTTSTVSAQDLFDMQQLLRAIPTHSEIDQALAVQPLTAATGITNPAAGEYPLDSVSDAIVSVPSQCVGAKRCPLLVQMPGGGQPASVMTGWLRPVANKYGFILLALSERSYKPGYVDTVLTEVLRRFAIEPGKIAMAGRCASGIAGTTYGVQNPHIFSRVISVSGGAPIDRLDPKDTTAEFLIDRAFNEIGDAFTIAHTLQAAGHRTTVLLGIRHHEHQWEDYDFVGRWLVQSWTSHPDDPPKAENAPVLTLEMLTKMTTFWTSFAKEPDSIRLTARRNFLNEIQVPFGEHWASMWMTDMPAFAAHYPTVAADFSHAGLTPQQHDTYRRAMFSARASGWNGKDVGRIDPASVLGKNIAFLAAHPDESNALEQAGVAVTENQLTAVEGCCTDPKGIDQLGSLGVWRTP